MIITTIAEVKECTPINKNMAWNSIVPYIQMAELRYLRPILGTTQYSILDAAVQANTLTPAQAAMLKRAKLVVVYMAMWEGYPHLNVFLSDMGVQQSKSREDTSVPASQWAYQEARKKYADGGQIFAEELYRFLQENQADYPDWTSSTGFSQYNSLLLRDNSELGQFLNTENSIRAYVALRPFLAEVQEQWVLPIIGNSKLQQLLADIGANAIAAPDIELLKKTRRAMAWQAFFEACPHLNVMVSGGSINIAIVQDGTTQHLRKAEEDRRQLLFTAENRAKAAWALVRDAWAIISPPVTPTDDCSCPIDNTNSTSFWV